MVPTVAFLPFAALGFLEPPVDLEITLEVVEQHKGLERWKDVQNVQTILVCFTIDINCLGIHELPPCSCGKNSMRTKNWLYAANVHPPLEVSWICYAEKNTRIKVQSANNFFSARVNKKNTRRKPRNIEKH